VNRPLVKDLMLKPRSGRGLVPFQRGPLPQPSPVVSETPLGEAQFVAFDIETTGNTPFLVIEIGAERFELEGSLSLFDTLVKTGAPINPYARRRHLISPDMLRGAPGFADVRPAFLHFAEGAALVEHSHDAFDSYLIGRGLKQKLEHPVLDTSALARAVLELPAGQTPGLARVVEMLGVEASPAHAALSDAQATAAVFRRLALLGSERLGWRTVGDLLQAQVRPVVDRSALEGRAKPRRRRRSGEMSGRELPAGPTRTA